VGTLILIRHGQARYGEADYDRLSARGEDQARALGRHLANTRLDAVFVGPLVRQQQTATIACEGADVPALTTLDGLAEYPAFEMLAHMMPKLVAEDPRFTALSSSREPRLLDRAFHTVLGKWARDEWQADGVERVGAFVERVRTAFASAISESASGARIACVTSAGPIGVAVALAFGIADSHPERTIQTSTVVKNASITELRFRSAGFDWKPDQISLVTFNVTSHLPADIDTTR